jgi:CAAX protease family protein
MARLFVYLFVGAAAALVALAFGVDPLVTEPWLGTTGVSGALLSVGVGTLVAAATVAATRAMLHRAEWARALHADLRPAVRDADGVTLALFALASGVGEELLFRGLGVQVLGIVLSSLAFGALHRVRGRARWPYLVWATLMGLAFGVLFRMTGSLAGPIVAHVAVNAANLRLLRDVDPAPRARVLGGLLR